MVMTNSTYDGLCYNVDAIKAVLGDAVDVLHFDEAWYAYANFHEFYDGFHGISSAHPSRSPHADHLRHAVDAQAPRRPLAGVDDPHPERRDGRLDMTRFNDAFMMHTSTSPQYGIIASCDVAAAMMEQPAGRALVQETIDEALSFRRAMNGVAQQLERHLVVRRVAAGVDRTRRATPTDYWLLNPGDAWHGFEGLAENHVMVDPIKVTILTPGLSADGAMQEHGIPAAVVVEVPVVPADRDREDRPLLLPRAVLAWASPRANGARLSPSSSTSRISTTPTRRSTRCLPALVEAHPAPTPAGAEGPLRTDPRDLSRDDVPKAQREMYTALPEMALRPADAYDRLVRGRVESVEIDDLMGRTLAVMIVPYPPGIPLIMPGERITQATKSIQDYLLYAREFDRKFPGFETDIHGLRFEPERRGTALSRDCVAEEGER